MGDGDLSLGYEAGVYVADRHKPGARFDISKIPLVGVGMERKTFSCKLTSHSTLKFAVVPADYQASVYFLY